MKNFKRLAALLMTAVMALSTASFALGAEEYDAYDENGYENGYENGNGYENDYGYQNGNGYQNDYADDTGFSHFPHRYYVTVTGEVVDFVNNEEFGQNYVIIEGEHGQTYLSVDFNTFMPERFPEKGDKVKAFYDKNAITTMIYPPRRLAMAIVTADEDGNFPGLFVGRFDENWNSYDGQMHLVIGEDTEIYFQAQGGAGKGEAFEGNKEELIGRKLFVEFGLQGRNAPPVHTPATRVVVLFERIAFGPEFIGDLGLDFGYGYDYGFDDIIWLEDPNGIDSYEEFPIEVVDFAVYDVTVNGVGLPGVKPAIVGDSIWPNYLPLRAIVEHLDESISWNDETREVSLTSPRGVITFRIGLPYFAIQAPDGYVTTHTLNAAPVIINDLTYVPINFFREIFGFNNAFFYSGVVVMNNDEIMQ